jgi:hypothetical protein
MRPLNFYWSECIDTADFRGGAALFHTISDILLDVAALVAILAYFGIAPKKPLWGIAMPLSRNWKLVIMLVLVVLALGMSGYAAYRGYHPKSVEKTVIVEKSVSVATPCPELPKESKPPKPQARPPLSGQQQSGADNVQSGAGLMSTKTHRTNGR